MQLSAFTVCNAVRLRPSTLDAVTSWSALLLLVLVAVLGIVRIERTFEPWPLGPAVGEIVRLRAGQSVSQRIELSAGALRGFSAVVQALPDADQPVVVNLRIRQPGEGRPILREAVAVLVEGGIQTLTTGLQAPLESRLSQRVELEIEVAPDSAGGIIVAGTSRENAPANALTINGAPTDPHLRANVAPIITVRTLSLTRTVFAASPRRGAMYLVALLGLGVLAAGFLIISRRRILGRHASVGSEAALILSALPLTVLGLATATATFQVGEAQYFVDELRDGFWSAALAFVLLIALVAGGLLALSTWLQRRRRTGSVWRAVARPSAVWRPALGFALWSLLVAVTFALWRNDPVAQTFGAVAELSLAAGIGLALLAKARPGT